MAMLISKFHRLIQSRLLWAFFLLVVVFSFVIWGTKVPSSMRHQAEANAPGKLHGKPVEPQRLAAARANTYLAIIMSLGRQIQITPEIDRELRDAAWERLVALDEADRLGLNATDDEVFQAIQSHEGFQSNGQFNKAYYKAFIYRFLAQLGFTERQFEDYIREEILLQKLRIIMNRAVLVSPAEIQRMFQSISDKFKIEFVALKPDLVTNDVHVTREDARTFFDKDPKAFTIPEKVKVKYVRISCTPMLEQAKVTDDDIKAYYEDNSDDFLVETNKLAKGTSTTNAADKAATTNAAATAKAEAPAAATTTVAQAATTGATETAASTNVAFVGSNVVDFASLTNSTFTPAASKYKPLEDVTNEIRDKLVHKAALDMAADKAMEFVTALAPDREGHALDFDQSATSRLFLVEHAGPFSAHEKLKDTDAGTAFNQTAFTLQPGTESYVSYPVRGSNYVYVIALEERIPSRVPTFDEVADVALPIARDQAIVDALSTKSKEIRDAGEAAVKDGKPFADAMQKYGLKTIKTDEFTASSGIEEDTEHAQVLLRGILTLNGGEVSELLPADDAILIAHVITRKPGDPTAYESLKTQIVSSIRKQNGRYVFDAWQKGLLKNAEIKPVDVAPAEDEEQDQTPPPAKPKPQDPDAS